MTHGPPPRDRILVFIPAYRCADQIGRVLAQFDDAVVALVDEVIVIDNGSPDDTPARAIAALQRLPLPGRLLRNVDNYNLGGSQKVAFDHAMRGGFDYAIILHGDDQADIRDFVEPLRRGVHRNHDAMLGSRFMPGARLSGYSALRTWGNRVFNLLYGLAAGRKISDLGSGLNCYRVDALRSNFYHRYDDALTFNYFLILSHAALRWRVAFVPITWREEDQASNVRMVRQTTRLLSILALFLFRRRTFLHGEHRAVPRDAYPSEIVFENDPAQADRA